MVPYLFYLVLRGVDAFYEENHYRFPGQGITLLKEEATRLKQFELAKQLPDARNNLNDIEIAREKVWKKTILIAKQVGIPFEHSTRLGKIEDSSDPFKSNNSQREDFCQDSVYQISRKHVKELCRYGGARIHNMAALMGGVASQEIIKILTCQYIPLDNTFIFNGISSCGASYSM